MVLDSKQLDFEKLDVAADEDAKEQMRAGSGKALVPQIFVNGKFKGVSFFVIMLYNVLIWRKIQGFEEFDEAKEAGELNDFLELQGVF